MKPFKRARLMLLPVLSLTLLLTASTAAQNKVVVIPLTKKTPLEPYAPLAAVSPPDSAYTVQTYGIVDNVTGLMWEKTASSYASSWARRLL